MTVKRKTGLLGGALCFALAPLAHGAAEVALHEANTSVGLKPTNATNEWKLETDPAMTMVDPDDSNPGPTTPLQNYIYTSGSLCDTYDPSQFHLMVNPNTDNYDLGWSVIGDDPFQVTGFEVLTNDGGLVDVQENPSNPAQSIVTDDTTNGPVGGGEAGEVENITFVLTPDLAFEALPATMDQFFYDINLVPNFETGPIINDVLYTCTTDSQSELTIAPNTPGDSDPPEITTFQNINGSTLPEPSSLSLLFFGAFGLLRRRKHKA